MKKTITRILAVIIAFTLIVSAIPVAFAADTVASGTAGEGVNWVLDADGTLTISGEGDVVVEWYNPPWYDYSDSILNVVVEEGITKIPSTAFCYEKNLISISIPASVINMDDDEVSMIWACYAIEEINVDPENPIYTSVDGVVFDKDMTRLCFYPANKAGDTYVIPNSVTKIANSAFGWVQQLQHITVPDTVISIGNDAFRLSSIKSITIGSGIKEIPNACFSSSEIENIVIPDNVETISSSAFWSCDELKHITIGTGIKSIDTSAFGYCDALTAIHYTGTEAQWNEIQINGDVQYIEPFAVHYKTDISDMDAVEATCTTSGHTAGKYCSACEDYITGEVTDEAYGHDFADGICQRDDCGYKCEHLVNDIFDDKCDDCGAEIELEFFEINVGEAKIAHIEETNENIYVKFVPEATGKYKLFSDNGGDHENIDPYACVYESDFTQIEHNDDIDGDELNYNFCLEFDANKGETYYIVLSAYSYDVEYAYTLDYLIDIAHQPTSGEPFVELTWDVEAAYQWNKYEEGIGEITDAAVQPFDMSDAPAFYDSENGWTGYYDNNRGDAHFFYIYLAEGESITVEATGNVSEIYIYNPELSEYTQSAVPDENGKVTLTSVYDMTYILSAQCDADATIRAYGNTLISTEIKGQTTNTLTNAVIGENYACVVTLADGTVLTSDILYYTYAISHQPTANEPYVEVTDDTDVNYQWYYAYESNDEITDEDVSFEGFPAEMELSAYDAQDGWTGIPMTEDTQFFFIVSLEVGETVKFVANEYAEAIAIFIPAEGGYGDDAYFDKNGEASLTAPVDGEYYVMVLGTADARLKAYKNEITYTKIDGETAAKLAKTEIGTSYACEVTFADGTTEMSKVVAITENYETEDKNENNTTNGNGNTNSNSGADNNVNSNADSGNSVSPQTGDSISMILAYLILIAGMSTIVILEKHKN